MTIVSNRMPTSTKNNLGDIYFVALEMVSGLCNQSVAIPIAIDTYSIISIIDQQISSSSQYRQTTS